METDFLQHLAVHANLTPAEVQLVRQKLEPVHLKKDDCLLREGQVCESVSLVAKGLLMYVKIAESGDEKVYDFALEGQWASQYQSMISKTPSPLSIRALEETLVYSLSFENLQQLYTEVPAFERVSRELVEKAFIASLNRTDDLQNLKAEQRYANLVKSDPQLLQRVPQYYIAGFLGIAPQSLSRIRKNSKS